MTLHDIIEKISMNSYTQYEIRVMLEELAKSQEQQKSPFVEDGLLAIPEEHIFDNLKEPNYPYVIEPFLRPILEPKKPELKHTAVFGSHGYSFHVTVTSECDREEIFKKCVGGIIWKIKDYDRLEYDYGCVLDHATCSRMSKTNYDKDTIYAVIDDAQRELHYFAVKDDINELINEGATIDEIKDYVNQL